MAASSSSLERVNKYYGKNSWLINSSLLDKMKNASNGEEMKSDKFKAATLYWYFVAHPNGRYHDEKDTFVINVHLSTFPELIESFWFRWRVYCPSFGSSVTGIHRFESVDNFGWSGCLSLDEIIKSNTNSLTFIMEIQILQIKYEENDNIFYPLSFYKPLKNVHFEWKFHGTAQEKIMHCYPTKQFESKIHENMWCLSVQPNGCDISDKGNFNGYVNLCFLPPNISKISVSFHIYCNQLNVNTKSIADFSYDDDGQYWSDDLDEVVLSFNDFLKLNEISFGVNIDIIKLYDNDGNEIDEINWKKYLKINKINDNEEEDKKQDEDPEYFQIKQTDRTYTKTDKNISISVNEIAAAVINTISTFTKNGVLSPILTKQISDFIQNASWSFIMNNKKIIQHFFHKNTYIFIEMHREVNAKKVAFGMKTSKITIKAKTQFFYVEAGNDSAKLILQNMAKKQVNDAFKFIKTNKDFKWINNYYGVVYNE